MTLTTPSGGQFGPSFTKCFVEIRCGRGWSLLWRRCDMLCTFSVTDVYSCFIVLHCDVTAGLVVQYRTEDRAHRCMRQLMALPLLPADHMQPAFDVLQARVASSSEALAHLLQYINATWLQHGIWAVENLSCYCQQVRTNNDVEGWHRRLNYLARRGALPLYMLIKLLNDEAEIVGLQVRLLSDGRLRRYARRTATTVNGRLWKLWQSFGAGERSTASLLRAASRLQLPNVMNGVPQAP